MVDKRVTILAIVAIILAIILVFICSGSTSSLFKQGNRFKYNFKFYIE